MVLLLPLLYGCATTPPYIGQGPHPQVSRGHPAPVVDFLGNVLALPGKLLLWDWRFCNFDISPQTEASLVQYLDANSLPFFEDTKFRLKEYTPLKDLKRLVSNHQVAWPYRLVIGLPVTLLIDVLLPGRLFPWGDYYNPYTNTAHLYSDDPPIAIHEAGHAFDFADFPHKGTYALLRIIPFMDLYQERAASDNAINYFIAKRDRPTELHAYRVLWPAYGTYGGAYLPIPFGSAAGALIGHVAAHMKVSARKQYYQRMDAALHGT